MLTPRLPAAQKSLDVVPQPLKIVLGEDSVRPLAFVLPPIDDVREIEDLRGSNFSLDESVAKRVAGAENDLAASYSALREKYERFSQSPVFLHRLAAISEHIGASDAESLRRRAFELGNTAFFSHALGDAIASIRGVDAAEEFFLASGVGHDPGAALRLAAFAVHKNDFGRAMEYVQRALRVDSLDFAARLFEGGLQLVVGDHQRAIQSFRIALRDRPTSSSAHCNLAVAYLGLGQDSKAMGSLKRAVALDPLNLNAVCLLADVSFRLKQDEEAVPSLRYYVQFEQRDEEVWSRLARASVSIGRADEAIAALKRQASIRDSASVWNNLGVAYRRLESITKSMESFAHAMRLGEAVGGRDYFVAARNAACLLSEQLRYKELLEFVPSVLKADRFGYVFADDEISDILPFFINAVYKQGNPDRAASIARSALASGSVCEKLGLWLVGALIGYRALQGDSAETVEEILSGHEERLWPSRLEDSEAYKMFFNNVAFALAEIGQIEKAERYMRRIGGLIHNSAFPTATLGLINLRKGRVERGVALYEEAISLAPARRDKRRIRQKLNLELAKAYLRGDDFGRARRLLERVASEKDGEDVLARQAQGMLRSLPQRVRE